MMSEEQLNVILDKLKVEKGIAFLESVPDAPKIKLIVSQLNSLPTDVKPFFHAFIKELKNDLFSSGAEIKGLEFGDLNNSDEAINVNEDLIKEKADIVKSQIGFDELLHDLVSSIKSHLEILKGYFILKLENSNLEDY